MLSMLLPVLIADAGAAERRMRPAPALAAGTVTAYAGGALAAFTHPAVSFAAVPLGGATGVHLFSDAGYGYESLGGLIGFVAVAPIGLGIRRAIDAPFEVEPGKDISATNLALTGLFSVGAASGATIAASLHSKGKRKASSLSLSPTLGTDGRWGARISGRL